MFVFPISGWHYFFSYDTQSNVVNMDGTVEYISCYIVLYINNKVWLLYFKGGPMIFFKFEGEWDKFISVCLFIGS